jgi:AraC-like DNA-binding protein
MNLKRATAHPDLQSVVRSFQERYGDLGSRVMSWPVAARPHQILDIHLAEPFRVRTDGGPARRVPETLLVGPQTFPHAQLYLSGRVHIFNILFQPTGLNRLFGVDMRSLVNQDPAASDVLGKAAARLGDAVRSAPDFPSRVRAAERWFATQLEHCRAAEDSVGHASRLLIMRRGQIRIDDVVSRSGLSARHFQRRFAQQVGLTPKSYARLIRFDRALLMHRDAPERPWTDILHELGYFDQAHFIREFRALSGIVPTAVSGDWENIFFPGEG